MQPSRVPFVDLATQHRGLEREMLATFGELVRSAVFIGGYAVERFEQEFAQLCGSRYCIGVGSGTDALRFALIAAGVEPGDVVITVPNTFIATTEAILQAGAEPAFVDVNERTYTMSTNSLREYLEQECVQDAEGRLRTRASGKRVTAIVPVHLYGQTVDMDPLLDLSERYHLLIVEDACQAHGAEYFSERLGGWKKAGSIGHAAAFSFYPGKNLGACGEAGAVTTDNDRIAQTCKMLRDHGQVKKYHHEIDGYNGRLDALQAALLSVKLEHLTEWNNKRRDIAAHYNSMLSNMSEDIIVPYEPPYSRSVYHLYVMRVPNRDALRASLADAGVETGIHYPIPLHLQAAYRERDYARGRYAVTERVASEIVSLPMYPELSREQQGRVIDLVMEHIGAFAALN